MNDERKTISTSDLTDEEKEVIGIGDREEMSPEDLKLLHELEAQIEERRKAVAESETLKKYKEIAEKTDVGIDQDFGDFE